MQAKISLKTTVFKYANIVQVYNMKSDALIPHRQVGTTERAVVFSGALRGQRPS